VHTKARPYIEAPHRKRRNSRLHASIARKNTKSPFLDRKQMNMEKEDQNITATSAPLDKDDEQLITFFEELKRNSLDTLEAAARQIIGLVTTLLGLFFGILAFKDNPEFLQHASVRLCGAFSAVGFVAALFLALNVVMPRAWQVPEYNLTKMRKFLRCLLRRKSASLKLAQIAFGAGTLFMLGIILILLWEIKP
jgi:hypothetical protein